MRNSRYGWRLDRKSFLLGNACAFLAFILLCVLTIAAATARGLTVELDSEEMALMIQEQVVVQAKRELPKMITGAKSEIPRIVEEEMKDQLSDRMEIAGFVFTMPDELMQQLKRNMQKNVENATGLILDGIDTQILAQDFGDDVYNLVKQTMQEELHGQTFRVFLFERIPVMVRVHVN